MEAMKKLLKDGFEWIKNKKSSRRYETEYAIHTYKNAQYGPFLPVPNFHSENFYQKIISEARPFINPTSIVLDVGCALGRLVFEYVSYGASASIGIDSSKKFINAALKIKNHKYDIVYSVKGMESALFLNEDIFSSDLADLSFDFISCINVLDRVINPKLLLDKLYSLLKYQKYLMIVTPYDWGLSPALKASQFSEIKHILNRKEWDIVKEEFAVPYEMKLSRISSVTYKCHLIILKKIQ